MATGLSGTQLLLCLGFPAAAIGVAVDHFPAVSVARLLCVAAGLPVSSVWHLLSVVVAPLAAAAAAAAIAVGTAAAAAFAVGTAGVDTGGVRTWLVDTFGVEEAVALVGTVLVEDKIASWEAPLQTMLRALHTMLRACHTMLRACHTM